MIFSPLQFRKNIHKILQKTPCLSRDEKHACNPGPNFCSNMVLNKTLQPPSRVRTFPTSHALYHQAQPAPCHMLPKRQNCSKAASVPLHIQNLTNVEGSTRPP